MIDRTSVPPDVAAGLPPRLPLRHPGFPLRHPEERSISFVRRADQPVVPAFPTLPSPRLIDSPDVVPALRGRPSPVVAPALRGRPSASERLPDLSPGLQPQATPPARPGTTDRTTPARDAAAYDYGLDPGESFEPEEDDEIFDLSRPHVMTVLGPIDPVALGFALHHEHVFCRTDPAIVADPDLWLDDPDAARQELELFFAAGGRAVVDMSPADYGRDSATMLEIAAHSPVHLIVVTGHHKDQFARPFAGDDDIDTIAARNLRELQEGTDGTLVKAGLIKAGTSLDTVTEVEDRALRAAARSSVASGAPISTHTERGTMALEQVAIMTDEGADPSRIILGHLDFRLTDLPYLRDVCATGAYVSFDQWSKTKYAEDSDRARVLLELADAGYLDQLLVSGDLARKSYQLSHGGSPGFVYFCDRVPLTLMEAGFDAPSVKRIFIDNPTRALTIHPPPRHPELPSSSS